jgi:hypothetical protein
VNHHPSANDFREVVPVVPWLIHYFFDRLYPMLPIFHRRLFDSQLAPNTHSPLLLVSMYAFTSHMAWSAGELRDRLTSDTVNSYISDAFRMIPEYVETPTVSTVQALLLLTCACMCKDNVAMAWLFLGMAKHFALRLGLHLDNGSSPDSNWVDEEIGRRTWWTCFSFDRMASSRIHRPHAVEEQHIAKQVLPATEPFFQSVDPGRRLSMEERLLCQRVAVDDVPRYLADPNFILDGFGYQLLIIRVYGHVISFVQHSAKHKFHRSVLTNNTYRKQVFDELAGLEHCIPFNITDLNQMNISSISSNYFRLMVNLMVAFCRLLLRCPVISTLDLAKAHELERDLFWQALDDAKAIHTISTHMVNANLFPQSVPAMFALPMFYAVLVFLAAIVANPGSDQSLVYLKSADELCALIRRIQAPWGSIQRYTACIQLLRTKYGLESNRVASVRPSVSFLVQQPIATSLPTAHSVPNIPNSVWQYPPAAAMSTSSYAQPPSIAPSSTSAEENAHPFGRIPSPESMQEFYEALQAVNADPFPVMTDITWDGHASGP